MVILYPRHFPAKLQSSLHACKTYPEEQIKGEIPMKQAHGVRSPIFDTGSAVRANAPTTGLMC